MQYDDPNFWRAGAISTTVVMAIVLAMLTIDSLDAINPGGSHVPPYTVINRHIEYTYNSKLGRDMPVIGTDEPLLHQLDHQLIWPAKDRGRVGLFRTLGGDVRLRIPLV